MEEETNKRDTRRSRSKTPLTLRSSVDRDVGTDGDKSKKPIKKNPTVETISEETPVVPTPAVPVQRSVRTKRNASKVITSDYSSDVSVESSRVNKETAALIASSVAVVPSALSATEQVTTITKTSSVTTTKSVKGAVERAEPVVQSKLAAVTSSTTKTTRSSNRETEQNESNVLLEKNLKLRTSTPRQASASRNVVTGFNDISTTNGTHVEEHVPFKEYKDAGEYWNKFPKTDYTYSKLSQQRREIKPGVLAMPNMSRRSLEHHHERVNQMIQRDPAQASFLRTRYESFLALRNRRTVNDFPYDSQDEIDLSQFGKSSNSLYTSITASSSATFLRRVFTTIITFFSSIYCSVTSVFRRKQNERVYYSRYATQEKNGFISRIGQSISSAISTIFRNIYLVISSVLFVDSWLLRSSNVSDGKKKGILIGLLVLLPLLLIGAYNLSNESDQLYYRNRLRHINDLSPITSLPSLPSIDYGSSFAEFTSRTAKLIPIALALIKTQTTNVSDRLKFLFDFNWNWLPVYKSTTNRITNNIKTGLSSEEYNNVLNHINAYIETVVAEKLHKIQEKPNDQKIDPKIALYIATIVKENIIEHKYVLSDEDIERIAEIVRIKLAGEMNEEKVVPFALSQENLEEISRIVKQNIEIHRHEWHIQSTTEKDDRQPIVDVDEILFKILTSPKLTDSLDQQIDAQIGPITLHINRNEIAIDRIRDDLEQIKDKLASASEMNQETRTIVANLKVDQSDLSDQMNSLQNQHNEQYEKLWNEINLKLSTFSENRFDGIDKHIRSVVAEIVGFKSSDGQLLQNDDIANWIRNVFVAKELLESRLSELNAKFEKKLDIEINQSANILIKDVSEKIKSEFLLLIEKSDSGDDGRGHVSLDEQRIKAIIKEALAVYDADKTGMVDYALETSGGQILSTRCTESFQVKSAQLSIFGIPLWYTSNTPRTVISPAVHPGECWAFQGFPGFLVLKLNHNIFVTGFTMEHIPRSLAPNQRIDSAPKMFTVLGLESESDQEPFVFGEYEYSENGTSLQYFPVTNTELSNVRSHNIVELRIESNHGNINYTCLYRFRVHGTITPTFSS